MFIYSLSQKRERKYKEEEKDEKEEKWRAQGRLKGRRERRRKRARVFKVSGTITSEKIKFNFEKNTS